MNNTTFTNPTTKIKNDIEFLFEDYILNTNYLSFEIYLKAKGYSSNDIKTIISILKLNLSSSEVI